MPIFRALPPGPAADNRLLALYRAGLKRHWSKSERLLARGFALARLGTGWSRLERKLLSSEVRASGLSMAERRGVHRLLNPAGYPLARNLLRNKALFGRHVASHGIAAPATYDERGALEDWLAGQSAIIAKPGYSSKGKGIHAFTRSADGWSRAIVEQLRSVLARHGVVQELLTAHPDLEDISPRVLPTLRVVTCRDERGEPEACSTVLRLGAGSDRPVDNFNAGGLAVRLGAGGRCEAAFTASGEVERHPATGAAIAGRAVPGLAEALALALRAHSTLGAGFTVVGWDIGLSDRGPIMVEGNWNPGTDIIQLAEGVGLDRTRLGELYRFHLKRIPADQWRRARAFEW